MRGAAGRVPDAEANTRDSRDNGVLKASLPEACDKF